MRAFTATCTCMHAGCSVPHLWRLLEAKLPDFDSNFTLSDAVKHFIWSSLLQQMPMNMHLFSPGPAAVPARAAPRSVPVCVTTCKQYWASQYDYECSSVPWDGTSGKTLGVAALLLSAEYECTTVQPGASCHQSTIYANPWSLPGCRPAGKGKKKDQQSVEGEPEVRCSCCCSCRGGVNFEERERKSNNVRRVKLLRWKALKYVRGGPSSIVPSSFIIGQQLRPITWLIWTQYGPIHF
jgi:hypothetical protein